MEKTQHASVVPLAAGWSDIGSFSALLDVSERDAQGNAFIGDVVALELAGNRKWGFRAKRAVTASPYVDPVEGLCYIAFQDHFVYALDVSSGFSSWRFRTNGPVISSPIVVEGMLYFGSADGCLYCLNAQTSGWPGIDPGSG